MSYIGSTPANKLVTSSDMEDGIVTTAKIANDAATADKIANAVNSAITANTAKTGISSAQTSAITANTSKTTNATHSGEVTGSGALTIAGNVVDEANLKVSNNPTNGYNLVARSGNTGGMTWEAAAGGNMRPAFFAYLNSDQNTSNAGNVKVAVDTEVYDSDNKYDNSSNYRFTPTVAGKYMVFANLYIASANGGLQFGVLKMYKNGSQLSYSSTSHRNNSGEAVAISWSGIIDMDNNDYLELYGQAEGGGNASYFKGATDNQCSSFGAYKIIE